MKSLKIVFQMEQVQDYLQQYQFHQQLNQFRESDKQQQALMKSLDHGGRMCIAIDENSICGYTIIVSPEENERWSYLDYIQVLGAIEVAPLYRGQGIAKKVLQGVLENPIVEKYIILSLEYAWHWDLKMVHGDIELYKNLLKGVLETGGFKETLTDEVDIAEYQHNFMMARIGTRITPDQVNEFMKLANYNSIF